MPDGEKVCPNCKAAVPEVKAPPVKKSTKKEKSANG